MQFPTLSPHFVAANSAMLPMTYPGENDDGRMTRGYWNFLKPWPTLNDFRQQCEHLHVDDDFVRDFLADTHDVKMEGIAKRSGFHVETVFEKLSIALLERDKRQRQTLCLNTRRERSTSRALDVEPSLLE
jgi:hypothetical protein